VTGFKKESAAASAVGLTRGQLILSVNGIDTSNHTKYVWQLSSMWSLV